MPITNYTELLAAGANWQARSDLTSTLPDALSLAEARLNRELGDMVTTSPLTGIINNRSIDISTLAVSEPITLYLTIAAGVSEIEMMKRADGDFPYSAVSGVPNMWSMAGTNITFDCPLLLAYTFRFFYLQRFALSALAPTNWLLTTHPDIYLAALLLWGGIFTEDDKRMSVFAAILEDGIPSVSRYLSRQQRSTMTADPSLLAMANGRRSTFNIVTGS